MRSHCTSILYRHHTSYIHKHNTIQHNMYTYSGTTNPLISYIQAYTGIIHLTFTSIILYSIICTHTAAPQIHSSYYIQAYTRMYKHIPFDLQNTCTILINLFHKRGELNSYAYQVWYCTVMCGEKKIFTLRGKSYSWLHDSGQITAVKFLASNTCIDGLVDFIQYMLHT